MRILIFSCICFSGCFIIEAQNKISFTSEFIDFRIDQKYFSVNGIYTFVNKTKANSNTIIFYPFTVNSDSIDSIHVINLKNMNRVRYFKKERYISFNLKISSYDTVEYNIFYRQPLKIKNTYILTTTKYWGAPLDNAVYTLTADKNIKITSFSFEPDSSKSNLESTIWFWHKRNFQPEMDFVITIDQ